MKKRKSTCFTEQEKRFHDECVVFRMEAEYPGYTGEEKYGIITGLKEDELLSKYGDVVAGYSPFVLLPPEYAEIRDNYANNENKHRVRNARGSIYSVDDDFSIHHPEYCAPDIAELFCDRCIDWRLESALQKVTETQRRRLIMAFVEGMSVQEIAASEGSSKSAISQSISDALKKMKKFLELP